MGETQQLHRRGGLALLLASLLLAFGAPAQSPASFYAKSGLTIVVGSTPGGYYDIAGRMVARHLAPFIPGNPTIIVQDLPGAAGLASGNRLANTIERDGKTIVVMSRALPQPALVGDPNAAFDPLTLTSFAQTHDAALDYEFLNFYMQTPQAKALARGRGEDSR